MLCVPQPGPSFALRTRASRVCPPNPKGCLGCVLPGALTPLLREEIAFWKIATSVAQEQHRASRAFTKLISDADEEASRTCHARQGRVGWWVNPRPKRARTKVAVQAELTGARGTRRDREIFLRPYCSLQYRSYAKFLNLVSLTFTDFKNTHVTPHSWRARPREAPRTT